MTWRRYLNLRNISASLFVVGVIVTIVSILLIVYNLSLAVGEKNEQLWKADVNRLVRNARRADDTWIMIPHLESANQILIDHNYEPTLVEFIWRAMELENSWDSVAYRKGLYFLKQDLSKLPTIVISYNHIGEVVIWFGGLFGGIVSGWIGWKGIKLVIHLD